MLNAVGAHRADWLAQVEIHIDRCKVGNNG